MEKKDLSQSNADGAEKLLACAVIAICGALTKTQREQVAKCLRMYAEANPKIGNGLNDKLLALATVSDGVDIAQGIINALRILDIGLTASD